MSKSPLPDAVFMEVEEDMRILRLKNLWNRYGSLLVGGALLAILGTGAGVIWHNHRNAALESQTAAILKALDDRGLRGVKLDALTETTDKPLSGLLNLHRAQQLEKNGKHADAMALYRAMVNKSGMHPIMKDLAIIHAVRLGMDDPKADPKQLLTQLEPLTKDAAPFRASALEMKGLLLQKTGDAAAANAIFLALSDDTAVPPSLRDRAKALISYPDVNKE